MALFVQPVIRRQCEFPVCKGIHQSKEETKAFSKAHRDEQNGSCKKNHRHRQKPIEKRMAFYSLAVLFQAERI